jgi:hypothetical protein
MTLLVTQGLDQSRGINGAEANERRGGESSESSPVGERRLDSRSFVL